MSLRDLLLCWLVLVDCSLVLGIFGSISRSGSFLGGKIVRPVSSLMFENILDGLLTMLWSICVEEIGTMFLFG